MLDQIFEINDLRNITVEEFQDSKIYYMDNFYKYPDDVVYYLLHIKEPTLWKESESPSFNGIHFIDVRHNFYNKGWEKVGKELANICGQNANFLGMVKTNCIKFIDKQFNDYKNGYWGPHKDLGYTCLIYLNTIPTATNLYESIEDDIWDTPEHFEPWRSKTKYKIIKQLEGRFNRLIIFDGLKFLHGMDISSDIFFNQFRINQVLFFK